MTRTNTHSNLVHRYVTALNALVAKNPAQASNLASHLAWLAGARLGTVVTRKVSSKGRLSWYSMGDTVLFCDDDTDDFGPGYRTIWSPTGANGVVHTMVRAAWVCAE